MPACLQAACKKLVASQPMPAPVVEKTTNSVGCLTSQDSVHGCMQSSWLLYTEGLVLFWGMKQNLTPGYTS